MLFRSSDNIIVLTIRDKNTTDIYGYDKEIIIYLIGCDPSNYGQKLFRELVDLLARNYRSVKQNIKDETLHNVRGVYSHIAGNSIVDKIGECKPHEEVIEFLNYINNSSSSSDIAFAYRVIASQSRRADEYEMFLSDLKQVLEFFSTNDDDFETLQFKLEEALLKTI